MGICGVATVVGSKPVEERELRAMGCKPVLATVDGSLRLPHVAIGADIDSRAEIWSSDAVTVACDANLYNFPRSGEDSLAKWIAGLYLADGRTLLGKLRGAFSLAVWDHKTRSLLLAVDRFGIKRLCWASSDGAIVFASQPSAILAGGRVTKRVNLSAIAEYFVYNNVPAPKTAFEGITRLAPGEYVAWNSKGTETKRYWDMRYPEDAANSEGELAEELFSRMQEAVRVTAADLDFSKAGCFLSGGTDSSSILGLVTQMSPRPVNAFSIGFSESRFNELDYARLAAKHFGAIHIEGDLGPDDAHEVIDKMVAAYDQPYANSSAIPTYWCAKLAREHGIEVLLAGDGGDELFGGNERYREEQIFNFYQTIPKLVRQWLIEPTAFGKIRSYVRGANTGNPERYCRWRLLQKFSPDLVLDPGMPFRNGHSDLLSTIRMHYQNAPASSELNRLLYVDVKMTLGDDDLPKVTRTAQLAGVNVRFPYLDHELAEFTGRLRSSMKVRLLEKRYLFKRATRRLLPREILQKKKHGFGLPIGMWLKIEPKLHAWAKEILNDPRTYQRGYFRKDFVEQLFTDMHQDDTPYFGDLLWVFLMLELWHRRHVEVGTC